MNSTDRPSLAHAGSAVQSGTDLRRDPLKAARERLFPPLKNKVLAEAAEALVQNRPKIAETLVSGYLEKKPSDPAALNLKADIARRFLRLEEAEQLLSRCVAEDPECAGYRFNYAIVLRRLDKFEAALAQLDRLLEADPDNPLYQERRASTLFLMGRLSEALVCRRAMTERYPECADMWLSFANSLGSMGHEAECIAAYHKVLELDRSSVAAYWRLTDLKTYRLDAHETRSVERALTNGNLPAEDRANLHYALGKAYGDEKQFAKSFDNYARANALWRLGFQFNPEALTSHRLNCETVFTETFFRERSGWGCDSNAPIFIVGLPRSGSTLIEQILSSHSAIEGLGELAQLDVLVGERLAASDVSRPAHEFWISGHFEFRRGLLRALAPVVQSMAAEDCRSWGEAYLKAVQGRRMTGRPFFTDKALRNFGLVGLILLVLPNAKIVDVRRHPLDCAWSCFKSRFPSGQPFTNRLADIGSHYANYVRLMAHFDRVQPGHIHRVIYEKLIADPEGEIRRLLDYLGLPFENACLRFHENDRAVTTLSAAQVRKPLYSGSAQWQPYEQWLGPVKAALGPVLALYPDVPV